MGSVFSQEGCAKEYLAPTVHLAPPKGTMNDTPTRMIVIGASSGGVEALLGLAPQLPADLAAPIVLVLHIGAHRSHLPELLNSRGPNRAVFARTGAVPVAGTIHVAPPDEHVLLENGVIRLSRGPKEHHSRPAIDPLFRSAALDGGTRVIGVVLTGLLDDGTAGLQAIKECGGTAVVQDPADAAEPSMPLSALESVEVDHVVRLDALAQLLTDLARPAEWAAPISAPEWLRTEHAITQGEGHMRKLATIGNPSGFTCPDCGGALFELLRGRPTGFLCHTGHAFSLRSLALTHEAITDHALWSGLRALQEKEAVLRRLAREQVPGASGAAAMLAEADQLAAFIDHMRSAVIKGPPGRSVEAAPVEPPTA